MARYIPETRSKLEEEALFECLWSILDTHNSAAGYIHVWQRLEDGSNHWLGEPLSDFPEAFWNTEWEFENGHPVDMYYRQQSYYVPYLGGGAGTYPPVRELLTLSIDLDPYSLHPSLTIQDAVKNSLDKLDKCGFPPPNHIDFSGNGFDGGAYIRWLFNPVTVHDSHERYRDRHYWTQTTKAMADFLSPFGADLSATDLARWLRVPGSLNSKYLDEGNGGPSFREYHHDRLIDLSQVSEPLGITRMSGELPAKRLAPAPDVFNEEYVEELSALQANHPMMHFANALWKLNELRGGIKEGKRNTALYTYVASFAGSPLATEIIEDKAYRFASGFSPSLPREEIEKTIKQGLNAAPYKLSYRWLIRQFGISPEEQKKLGICPRPAMHNEQGKVIPANREWHRQDATRRAHKSRRLRGVRPLDVVNAEKSNAIATAKKKAVEAAISVIGPSKPRSVSEVSRLAGVAWKTAKKHMTDRNKTG